MARKLKQIAQLINCTGASFQEEMWQIVSITSNFRISIGIFSHYCSSTLIFNFTYCLHI